MRPRIGLCTGLLFVLGVASGRAQSTLFTFYGDQANDFFGSAVADAGDVDGDGVHDLITGAPLHGTFERGFARVLSGRTGHTFWTFNGGTSADYFGYAVSSAGDVNHDGHADLLVGSPRELNGTSVGSIRIFSGENGATLFTIDGAVGDPLGDWFGFAVTHVGDLNGDGTEDFVVGAPINDQFGQNAGLVTAFSGADASMLHTWHGNAQDYMGSALGSVGDLNNDGVPEILIGAPVDDPGRSGYMQVISGIDGSVLYEPTGDGAGDFFGRSVSGGHDVDMDGVPDFIVAAQHSTFAYARVFSGKDGSILWTVSGSADGAFGSAACTATDINGDGAADFVVGEPFATDPYYQFRRLGAVHVFSGATGEALFTRSGCTDTQDAALGWSVTSMGDLNNDGLGDIAFGSPYETWFPQINQGAVRVIAGTCCPSLWLNYGDGWAGTHGVPAFVLREDPDLCTQVPVMVGNSYGTDTVGLIMVGGLEDQLPTWLGGTIWLKPTAASVLPLRGRGDRISLDIPCDSTLRGAVILAQCLEIDPGASKGVSFSRGLKAVLGD